MQSIQCQIFLFLCFLLVILLFHMAPNLGTEVLRSFPKGKGYDMPYRENIGVR